MYDEAERPSQNNPLLAAAFYDSGKRQDDLTEAHTFHGKTLSLSDKQGLWTPLIIASSAIAERWC